MKLVPDDGLTEIQAMFSKDGRVVATVRIAAPNVEAAARRKHTGDVPEPGVQQTIEFLVGQEVVCELPVLRGHLRRLRAGAFSFSSICTKRTVPCGNRNSTSRLDPHVVRRVGIYQVDRCAVQ